MAREAFNNQNHFEDVSGPYYDRAQFVKTYLLPTLLKKFPGLSTAGQYRDLTAEVTADRSANSDHYSGGALDISGSNSQMLAAEQWLKAQPYYSFSNFHPGDHLHVSLDIDYFGGGDDEYIPPMNTETDTSTDVPDLPPGYPDGMSLFNVGAKSYLFGKVGGARVYFELDGPPPMNVAATYTATLADWQASVANGRWTNGGYGSELYSMVGQSWESWVDQFLYNAGIKGTAAENDMSVMQVMAEKLGRQDMSDTELAGRLRGTEYWNSTTEAFRKWNDLSPPDQSMSIMDSAGWIAGQYFSYASEDLNLSQYDANGDGDLTSEELQQGNPEIYNQALAVASGKKTQLQVTNDFLKPLAAKNPNSTWSRTLRDELKNQGQHEVDIAGAAQEVQRLYRRYGIEVSLTQAKVEGERVAMNQLTFPDLEETLKDMSQGLYPMKPRDLDVETYSMPYRRTFESMMETSDPGMFDRGVQSAMNAGISLAEYKDSLRADDRWQTTDNAREEYVGTFSALGARMGY